MRNLFLYVILFNETFNRYIIWKQADILCFNYFYVIIIINSFRFIRFYLYHIFMIIFYYYNNEKYMSHLSTESIDGGSSLFFSRMQQVFHNTCFFFKISPDAINHSYLIPTEWLFNDCLFDNILFLWTFIRWYNAGVTSI